MMDGECRGGRGNLVFVGDVALTGEGAGEGAFAFAESVMADGDVVMGNLETVLTERVAKTEKAIVFRASVERAPWVRKAGFTMLNVANNHALDCGPEGLVDCVRALEAQGVQVVGVRLPKRAAPVVRTVGDLRVGFLGYTKGGDTAGPVGVCSLMMDVACREIRELRDRTDAVVVSVHWGTEFVNYPSPEQQRQARRMVESGASLVVGHHPHVVQGIERYQKGLIAYSLGNFNTVDREIIKFARGGTGLVLRISLGREGVVGYETAPLELAEGSRPTLLTAERRRQFEAFLMGISEPLQGRAISPVFWYANSSEVYLASQLHAFRFRIANYGLWHAIVLVQWMASLSTLRMVLGMVLGRLGIVPRQQNLWVSRGSGSRPRLGKKPNEI